MKENLNFCQEPSGTYLKKLDEWGGDPRSTVSSFAIERAGNNAEKGWQPTWDARDARKQTSLWTFIKKSELPFC